MRIYSFYLPLRAHFKNRKLKIKSSLCRWILQLMGWKLYMEGEEVKKCVICVAPHTSNVDLTMGKLFYNAMGKKAKFLIKKEWFVFPLNFLFKGLGGIPINRSKNSSTTEQLAVEFAKRDTFHLAIAPEGTRKRAREWKSGFYYIALKACVPIQIGIIDYRKKEIGIKSTFYPTGNANDDILAIRSMYEGVKGYNRKNFAGIY
jgi:1-acyl-sn-glycerol-3-phosphate acyltransferase